MRRASIPCLFGFTLVPLLPVTVASQEAIVVTATRFPERALDAPAGMRVISARDIQASPATSLPEVLITLGGLHGRNLTGTPDLQLDLRGYGITGDQNLLVLLDGVRMNSEDLSTTPLSAIPLNAIERIEIMPGSGATLYGAGATAGTINIVTRAPALGSRSASLSGLLGSYGTSDLRAGVNAGGELVALSLHASRRASQNYRANNALRQDSVLGDLRLRHGALQAGLKFGSDWQRLRLPGERNERELQSDPRGTSKPEDFSDRDGDLAVLYLRYGTERVELAADLSVRGYDAQARSTSAFGYLFGDFRYRSQVFSPRARFEFDTFGARSSLVAGADLTDSDYRRRTWITYLPAGVPAGANASTQSSRALYLRYSLAFTDALKASLGLRRQRVSDGNSITFFGPLSAGSRDHAVSARELALRYTLPVGLTLYATSGTSFRFATADDNAQTATGNLLDPQTARHFEAGAEYAGSGSRARLALYRTDLEKEIYFSPIVVPFGANTNLSPTRREGVELEAGMRLGPVDASARIARQLARFRSGVYGGTDVSGKDVPLVPRVLAGLRLAWRIADATQVSANVTHVGRQRYDNDQDNRFPASMPAYTLVDLKAGQTRGGWRLSAGINNVFDRKYYSYGIVGNFNCATPVCAYPQAGRTMYVSAERSLQ
ncbi:MAG: TonB-dependent receptor [Burkholderiales bacterium]|nr:TonB-dependent receptor [Burkholderiales bacterium]